MKGRMGEKERGRMRLTGRILKIPSWEGAERKEIAQWAILAKEPDCRARGGFLLFLKNA
jgi:hypothetical protein